MRTRGWSLTELLVVVAIIAVIIALLLPVFWTARRTSYRVVCLSNLRQLAQAVAAYTNDYDERFPMGFYAERDRAGLRCTHTIWDAVEPYQRSSAIGRCPIESLPTDLTRLAVYRPVGISPCSNESRYVALLPNWCLFTNNLRLPHAQTVSFAMLPFPSLTAMWSDARLSSSDGNQFDPISPIDPRHGYQIRVPPIVRIGDESRYHGIVQAVFVDGHARAFQTKLLPDYYSRGDFIEVVARIQDIMEQSIPHWRIQGGSYHNQPSFHGWVERPHPFISNQSIFRCYPREIWICDEWE